MTICGAETTIDTLIIVCCHAIYNGAMIKDPQTANHSSGPSQKKTTQSSLSGQQNCTDDVYDESNWLIESFQQGEVSTFIDHVRTGVEHLAANDSAILCFSGGATKLAKTTKTEAQGYRDVAVQMDWFQASSNALDNGGVDDMFVSRDERLADKTFTEEWATDSYQNVLLSLIQFPIWVREYQIRKARRKENQGGRILRRTSGNDGNGAEDIAAKVQLRVPKRLVIVTHAFKRERFFELHLPAIQSLWEGLREKDRGWNVTEVGITGANPPFDPIRMRDIEEGDKKRGYGVWKTDLHGTSDLLSEKRRMRGWDPDKFLRSMDAWFEEYDMEVIRRLVRGTKSSLF